MKRLLVAFALLTTAAGNGPPVVTALLRPMISIYNKDGSAKERLPKWTLPPGGALIVDHSATGQVGIKKDGEIAYLRNSEIETENERGPCLDVATTGQSATQHTAASGGIHSGLGGTNSACVTETPK